MFSTGRENVETFRAHAKASPTIAAATHASAVQPERSSWPTDSSKPSQIYPGQRVMSGGYGTHGKRGKVKESRFMRRWRRRIFGSRRSPTDSKCSIIGEKSQARYVGMSTSTSVIMHPKLMTVASNAPKLDHTVGDSEKDLVIFDCFAPCTVVRGMSFDLMVLVYLRRQREEVLEDAQRLGAVEAGIPKTVPMIVKNLVKVELDLPDKTFKTPSNVREFIWTGEKTKANFKVECKPEAKLEEVTCGVKIIEGNVVTRLSFSRNVVQPGLEDGMFDRLETTAEIEPHVNVINARKPTFVEGNSSGVQILPNRQQQALVVFSKIRLENLPLPPDRERHSMVRVKFRVSEGSSAAETLPRLPNSDGSVEWTEPIELRVDDSRVLLIAVVSQRQKGSWHMVNGGRFKGPTVDFIKSDVWQRFSTGTVSPSFYAKAEVLMDDVPQGEVGLPPSSPTVPISDHVSVDASSGSHDPSNMSRGTSLSSTSYETTRDWLPAISPFGGRAPSGMQRAESKGNDIVPTVHVDPLGAAVWAERSSWWTGYPEPRQEPSMRRTRSEGYAWRGNKRYVREGNGPWHRPRFGTRQSSSHTDDSLIREELLARSGDINSLPSPVGTYREPRLLDERIPLSEDIEEVDESLESSGDLMRSWGGPALASEIGGMTEEAKTERRPPPFAPEVDSPRDVPQTSIECESRSKKRRPSSFFAFGGKTKRGPLTAGAMKPQFRSEYADDGSCRVEKMAGRSRRRLAATSIGEDMTPTDPTVGLERPGRVLHRMPLQEAKARDEPWVHSPVREQDAGVVGSDGEETDPVAPEEVAESQQVDSTVIRADAKAEGVKLADSTVAKAEMETKDGAETSPERPPWLKVDGLRHEQKMQEYEQRWNILGSKAFMSPLASPPDTDLGVEEESPSGPALSTPPLSLERLSLTRADAFFHPHPKVGPCSPVSHDEEEGANVVEEFPKVFFVSRLEQPHKASPPRLITRPSCGKDDAPAELPCVSGVWQARQPPAVMQPNPSIQSIAPNPDRAVGEYPVIFDCFAPRTVVRGMSFELVMFAYLRQQREEVLRNAQRRGEAEAGTLKAISIMLYKRVTVVLDLPDNAFGVTQSYHYNTLPYMREFIWTGEKAEVNFNVECKREAELGWITCGAKIIEGKTMTRLSFRLEVVQIGTDGRSLQRLDATMDTVEPSVNIINPRELKLLKQIGSGDQGETYEGWWGSKRVAVKRLKHCRLPPDDLHREAAIMALLGHFPHTVEFYGICRWGGVSNQRDDTVEIVTKFEEGGSINDALGIVDYKGSGFSNRLNGYRSRRLTAGVRLRWARQVATALANVHSKGVLHNDVACRNALLSRPGADGHAVLCDFGLSRLLWGDGLATVKMMDGEDLSENWPLNQMPREALNDPWMLSRASDTWMFGTMLYEMFEQKAPFAGLKPNEARKLILEGKTLDTPEMLIRQGPELLQLYKECLHQECERRPQMEDIVGRLDACLSRRSRRPSPMVY